MDKQPQNTKCYVDKFDIMQRYRVGDVITHLIKSALNQKTSQA